MKRLYAGLVLFLLYFSASAQITFSQLPRDLQLYPRDASSQATAYADQNLPDLFGSYYYRLRAYSSVSESTYSNVASAKPLVLGLEPAAPVVQVYPNPMLADRLLYVNAAPHTLTSLSVRNAFGQSVKNWTGSTRNTLTVDLNTLAAGLYVVDMQLADGQTLRRKIVIR